MLEDATIVFRGSEPEGPPEMPPLQLENFIPVIFIKVGQNYG